MDKKTEDKLEELGTHTLHGFEGAADVIAHGLGGAVEGVADGVESVSATTKARRQTSSDHEN